MFILFYIYSHFLRSNLNYFELFYREILNIFCFYITDIDITQGLNLKKLCKHNSVINLLIFIYFLEILHKNSRVIFYSFHHIVD